MGLSKRHLTFSIAANPFALLVTSLCWLCVHPGLHDKAIEAVSPRVPPKPAAARKAGSAPELASGGYRCGGVEEFN